jgi:putative ABC transport system ATP-binding protein
LQNVSRIFDDGAITALRNINLSIFPGEFTVLLGPSGSGKSTLIHIMGGFDACTSGSVCWKGRPVTDSKSWTALRRSEIGFVFQEFHLLPTLTATENVELALAAHGLSTAAQRRRAADLLEQVGLGARMKHLPHALSGGERQRVAIARSIANRPTLLLADEPTGNLDSESAGVVTDLLLDIHRTQKTTLVVVTHESALAGRGERRVRIKDGQIVDEALPRPDDRTGARREPC